MLKFTIIIYIYIYVLNIYIYTYAYTVYLYGWICKKITNISLEGTTQAGGLQCVHTRQAPQNPLRSAAKLCAARWNPCSWWVWAPIVYGKFGDGGSAPNNSVTRVFSALYSVSRVFSAKSKISLIFEITVCYSLHIFDIGCKFVD